MSSAREQNFVGDLVDDLQQQLQQQQQQQLDPFSSADMPDLSQTAVSPPSAELVRQAMASMRDLMRLLQATRSTIGDFSSGITSTRAHDCPGVGDHVGTTMLANILTLVLLLSVAYCWYRVGCKRWSLGGQRLGGGTMIGSPI